MVESAQSDVTKIGCDIIEEVLGASYVSWFSCDGT